MRQRGLGHAQPTRPSGSVGRAMTAIPEATVGHPDRRPGDPPMTTDGGYGPVMATWTSVTFDARTLSPAGTIQVTAAGGDPNDWLTVGS
jgi:hypothetical protein